MTKNYRPIYLLPNTDKIFEKITFATLKSFFEKHSILSDRQNGFDESNI